MKQPQKKKVLGKFRCLDPFHSIGTSSIKDFQGFCPTCFRSVGIYYPTRTAWISAANIRASYPALTPLYFCDFEITSVGGRVKDNT